MNFTTPVNIKPVPMIDYQSHVMMIGSCFAQNVGERMLRAGYKVLVNPNGITYNPMSVSEILHRLIDGVCYTGADLMEYNARWFSLMHHGMFDGDSCDEVLDGIRVAFSYAEEWLEKASHLIVTFGSSWVYEYEGNVVSNCHKMPARCFVERQLSVSEIVEEWEGLLDGLWRFSPALKVIFTVSPVRYMGRGAHHSQINKATLLLAVNKLCDMYPQLLYFPSYEIVLDELRDYRFFAEDMLHPSGQALDYVWQRFVDTYMTDEARAAMLEVEKLKRALEHRPRNPESEEYKAFRTKIETELACLLHSLGTDGLRL